MNAFIAFFFSTIIPILILSIPLWVVLAVFLSQRARNRHYSHVLRMDDGFTFLVEPGGNILIKPRGWFTKISFVVYGGFGIALVIGYLSIALNTRSLGDMIITILAAIVVAFYMIHSVDYLRYGSTYIDIKRRMIQTRNLGAHREVLFADLARLTVEDVSSSVDNIGDYLRYGYYGPAATTYIIKLVLRNKTELQLGRVTIITAWALGNQESRVGKIKGLLRKAFSPPAPPKRDLDVSMPFPDYYEKSQT